MASNRSLNLVSIGCAGASMLAFYYSVTCLIKAIKAAQDLSHKDHYLKTMDEDQNRLAHFSHPDHSLRKRVFNALDNMYARKCSSEKWYAGSMAVAGGILFFGGASLCRKAFNSAHSSAIKPGFEV
jgi:hypothetical protein